jgi:site-specific DNA recombinase
MKRSSRGSSSTGVVETDLIPLPTANMPGTHNAGPVTVQRRAVADVRETTEEQGLGYSPDGPRQAITRYAAEHDLQLVDEYLDFETGRAAEKRPAFQRLIEDAMAHRFDAVLLFHTSRFARNTVEAKRYKKLLRSELGIEVVSVTQPIGTNADDPAAFLAESVHEIFDEYYSVSLSFWTKMGLKEKARQGYLTGSLPWGYRKGPDRIAVPEPERAHVVRLLFEMYSTGEHSNRDLAKWLNEHGYRRTRRALFCADTVRDMLRNAAYCGYVSAQRDRSKTIRGHHHPLIDEALFDRVQDLRRQRTTTLNPGRPSARYVLRGIVRCERCDARMHGTAVGRKGAPRYYCSSRRKQHTCDQPLAAADVVEQQIIEFVAHFKPGPILRDEILRRLAEADEGDSAETVRQRKQLLERRRRLQDLYELGDLTRPGYIARRNQIDAELDQLAPGPAPDLDEARAILDDFALFWNQERDFEARRQLLGHLFERVWIDDKRIVAVRPKPGFAPFFDPRTTNTAGDTAVCKERERRAWNTRLARHRN